MHKLWSAHLHSHGPGSPLDESTAGGIQSVLPNNLLVIVYFLWVFTIYLIHLILFSKLFVSQLLTNISRTKLSKP